MPPIKRILRERAQMFGSLRLSSAWGMAYKSLAAAAVVLLLGAVCQRAGPDVRGALLLFKLGLAAQAGAMTCFFIAAYRSRRD
jgi:hypothetical protein